MIIAFQILMLLLIVITFFGVMGEKKDLNLRANLAAICIASIGGFVIATFV